MVEFLSIVFATHLGEVVLTRGNLRGELFGLTVVPGSIGQVALLEEGTGLVICELVVLHNKFMKWLL